MSRLTALLVTFMMWGVIAGAMQQRAATSSFTGDEGTVQVTFLVKPYLQRVTQDGVTILWETAEPAVSIVEYGAARIGDEQPNLGELVETSEAKTLHMVRLGGLAAETAYFYRVRCRAANGAEVSSEIRAFKTAVRDESPFVFAAFSDSQDNPPVWERITRHAYNERPDFAIHAGDLVGVGAKKSDWTAEFFPPAQDFMSRVPMFTILGNHEGDAPFYYDYFDNPAPEYYYTFDYGNARFFMLDSCRPVTPGSPQYNWLAYELSHSDKTWNFVVHHHPPYTSDEDDYGDSKVALAEEGDSDVRPLIELYERFNVDIVFYGHIHDYERSWPIRANQVDPERGVLYLQIGGSGGGLENYAPTRRWHMAKVRRCHHFCMIRVAGRSLSLQAFDDEWRLFDQYEINKPARPANATLFRDLVPPPVPRISPDPAVSIGNVTVEMCATPRNQGRIHYTVDGSLPTAASPVYTGPVSVPGGTCVSARVIPPSGPASEVAAVSYRDASPLPAVQKPRTSQGLRCIRYDGSWESTEAMLGSPAKEPVPVSSPALQGLTEREEAWGATFDGYLDIPTTGVWRFATLSDDGTRLFLDRQLVVDNDGSHAARMREGAVALEAGLHHFLLHYFQDHGGAELQVYWQGPESDRELIPTTAFWSE